MFQMKKQFQKKQNKNSHNQNEKFAKGFLQGIELKLTSSKNTETKLSPIRIVFIGEIFMAQ